MELRAVLFDAEGDDREIDLEGALQATLNEHQLLWIDICEPDNALLEELAARLSWQPESLRRICSLTDRPSLANYGDYFQLRVLGLPSLEPSEHPVPVELIVGPTYVVTVPHKPVIFLNDFLDQLRGNTRIGSLDSMSFVSILLELHITSYFRALDLLEGAVDRFDEKALRVVRSNRMLPELIGLRRQVAFLRRFLSQHREVYNALIRPDIATFNEQDTTVAFQILHTQFQQAMDAVENARDLVVGSFDVLMMRATDHTNDIIRVLTVSTVCLGIAATVSGIFGMNFSVGFFNMAEFGFFGAIVVMLLLILGVVFVANRKGWL